MTRTFIFIFFTFSSILYSQNDIDFLPISKMNAEEKIMYNLLKESTLKKSVKPNDVHFFPIYSIIEDDKCLELKTFIYDEPTYEICQLVSSRATYPISVKFFKNSIDNNKLVIATADDDFLEKEYFMSVTEVPVTENRKAWNYVTPKILSTISSSKPIFDNKYNNAYFYKHQAINDIDKSIYKIQEHRRNIYFSNFAIIYNGNNYGVINKENKIIVPYEYEYIALTRFGLLVRNKNQENFFIGLKNNIISSKYEAIKYSNEICSDYQNYLLVKKNGLFNVLDNNFDEKLETDYDSFLFYANLKKILATKNDKQVIIDSNIWKETNIKYDKIDLIDKNTFIVKQNEKYGLLKSDGTILLDIKYDNIEFSIESLKEINYIVSLNNKFGLVNNDGKFLTDIKYDEIKYLGNGNFNGKIKNKFEIFDRRGILKK